MLPPCDAIEQHTDQGGRRICSWQALCLPQHTQVETHQDGDWQIGADRSCLVGGLKEIRDLLSDPVEQGQDHLLMFRVLEMFPGITQQRTQALIERESEQDRGEQRQPFSNILAGGKSLLDLSSTFVDKHGLDQGNTTGPTEMI